MKPEDPSFFRLFRRSRYYRRIADDVDSEEANVERSERERFAAAVVGFCLKYSGAFRDHFWQNVCRVPGDPDVTPSLQIEIEPFHWADLRLSAHTKDSRFVWVVEFKAGAPLEPKQNPDDATFTKPGVGYGSLLAASEAPNRSRLRYVVLGAHEKLSLQAKNESPDIRVSQRGWASLLWDRTDDSLVSDLFDCLGKLGISCFRMKEARTIQVTSGFGPAADAWEVLTVLGSEDVCDFRPSYWRIEAGRVDSQHFNIGAFLRRPPPQKETSSLHRQLFVVLDSPGSDIAWIGYETGPGVPGQFRRSVWLNCHDRRLAEQLCEKIRKRISDCGACPDFDGYVWCALISSGVNSVSKDLDWFHSVLKAAVT